MAENITALIKKLSPFLEEDSEVFRELAVFFGEGAKIPTDIGDLSRFLGRRRLYRVIRFTGKSYKDCVYQLVDDHPESMESLGMLRYYISPNAKIKWEEIENAEIALGKELTMNVYGWMPDAWTAFEGGSSEMPACETPASEMPADHQMVAILAFDYGE